MVCIWSTLLQQQQQQQQQSLFQAMQCCRQSRRQHSFPNVHLAPLASLSNRQYWNKKQCMRHCLQHSGAWVTLKHSTSTPDHVTRVETAGQLSSSSSNTSFTWWSCHKEMMMFAKPKTQMFVTPTYHHQ